MNWLLTNPTGLWALLGVPALVIIHYLQRQSRTLPISTLFLLEQSKLESAAGRRFDRFTHSVPFWLQLLAILLLTWILVQPRQIKSQSTQRIAIVLDSSASMQVFHKTLPKIIEEHLPTLAGNAQNLEFLILESAPDRPRIYQGDSQADLKKALLIWKPTSGTIDPSSALRLARELVEAEGHVIYLTDTPLENLPFGASLLAVGHPIENCGFTGITYEEKEGALIWRALIRNYGQTTQTREWFLETSEKKRTQPKTITLAPGEMLPLQGKFPDQETWGILHLTEDEFLLDDTLAMRRPKEKTLLFEYSPAEKSASLAQKMLAAFAPLQHSEKTGEADLTLLALKSNSKTFPEIPAIIILDEEKKPEAFLKGGIVTKKHSLMDGLNWQPLLIRKSQHLPSNHSDEVLLWQGEQALIFLRGENQLVFNFDLTLSNALKLPATAVLLHRFCTRLQQKKIGPESMTLDTGQMITIRAHDGLPLEAIATTHTGKETRSSLENTSFKTPSEPGFLAISQSETPLLSAAICFADTREADFRSCDRKQTLDSLKGTAIQRHSRQDRHWRLWFILTLIVVLLSWKFVNKRN